MDSDLVVTEVPGEHRVEPALPRMGIEHFMLWMAISAGIIVVWVRSWQQAGLGQAILELPMQLHICQYAFSYGAIITCGIVLVIASCRRRQIVLNAPGHWVAVAVSLEQVCSFAFFYLQYWSMPRGETDPSLMILGQALSNLMPLVVYMVGFIWLRHSRWHLLLAGLAMADFLEIIAACLSMWLLSLYMAARILSSSTAIVMLVTTVVEARRGKRRDWLHNLCMIGLAIPLLFGLVSMVLVVFLT